MWIEQFLVVTVDKSSEEHQYFVYIVTAEDGDDAVEQLREGGELGESEYVVTTAGISPDSASSLVCTFTPD